MRPLQCPSANSGVTREETGDSASTSVERYGQAIEGNRRVTDILPTSAFLDEPVPAALRRPLLRRCSGHGCRRGRHQAVSLARSASAPIRPPLKVLVARVALHAVPVVARARLVSRCVQRPARRLPSHSIRTMPPGPVPTPGAGTQNRTTLESDHATAPGRTCRTIRT